MTYRPIVFRPWIFSLVRRLVTGSVALVLSALAVTAAEAQQLELTSSVLSDGLDVNYEASCSDGSAPTDVRLHWEPLAPAALLGKPSLEFVHPPNDALSGLAASDTTTLLAPGALEAICNALGGGSSSVTGLVYFSGLCGGKPVPACDSYPQGAYLLEFMLDCDGGSEKLTGPTHTSDTGPPKLTGEVTLTQTGDGDFGTGGSVAFSFGSCDQQAVKLSVETSTGSESFDGGAAGGALLGIPGAELGLFPARAGVFRGEPAKLNLDFTFVDVSYIRPLTPPTRRLVPEISAGLGYAFVDAHGSGGGRLSDARDLFEGLDQSSLTLNAGLRLRINLGRRLYPGGPPPTNRYLYLGLQSRWFEQRDREEIRTAVVAGVGFGIRPDRRPKRTPRQPEYGDQRPTKGSEPR